MKTVNSFFKLRLTALLLLTYILTSAFAAKADNPTYYCNNGSTITLNTMLGLVFYNDKDHVYSYNYNYYTQDGWRVYAAKHGPVICFTDNDGKTLYAKWDNSENVLIYNYINGTVNDNRHMLKSVNNALSQAIALTANNNYQTEVAPYQGGGYNNNNNSNNRNNNNMPTEQWVRCDFCGGDGVSPIAKFTAGSEYKWCNKCNKMGSPHYHERCPNCKGEGRVKRLR